MSHRDDQEVIAYPVNRVVKRLRVCAAVSDYPCDVPKTADSHFVRRKGSHDTSNNGLAFAELSMFPRPFTVRPWLGDDNARIGP